MLLAAPAPRLHDGGAQEVEDQEHGGPFLVDSVLQDRAADPYYVRETLTVTLALASSAANIFISRSSVKRPRSALRIREKSAGSLPSNNPLAEFETRRSPAAIAHEVQPIEEIPTDQGDETQVVEFETQTLLDSKALEARHDDVAVEQRYLVCARASMAAKRLPPELPYACSARCHHVEARPERPGIDQAPSTLDSERDAGLRELTSLLGREADLHFHGRIAVAVRELNH